MLSLSLEKTGRNDPCPCGSGKKYKRCCINAYPAFADSAWKCQREASDRLTDAMLAFAKREFPNEFYDAWGDFNQTFLDVPETNEFDDTQIFIPYFLFEWDPERPTRQRSNRPRGGLVAQSFLAKASSRLSELEQLILEQAVTQPLSFYEVILSKPGESITLRDILIGGDTEVVERSASRTLRPGDICYGQIRTLPEVSTLGRLAPISIPPGRKAEVIGLRAKLRKKIAKQRREIERRDLVRYAEEVRSTYLAIRDSLRLPPKICNTDGDPVVFHTLNFQVGSAQTALDALAPLAWGFSKEELLDAAEVGEDGTLHRVEFDWSKKGNKIIKTWDNTIMGHLKVSGRSLVAEVNSAKRAELLRHEIEKRMGILAAHQSTATQTPEERLKEVQQQEKLRAAPGTKPVVRSLDPEMISLSEKHLQKQMEAWIRQKIPALGGRTPIQAVSDPDGREMVEALLLDWERRTEGSAEPGIIRPNVGSVRKLLKLQPFIG